VTDTPIARAGIVAKRGLLAASEHLDRLVTWLTARQIEAVYETETAALAGTRGTAPNWSRDELPNHVDLIIVLGGDGTLLSMATRIARTERNVPMLGVNFGSLGFLTETRIDELYSTLESVLAGTATYDERTLLSAEAYRERERFDARVVLNDVVFTKAALSRIIELAVSVSTGLMTKVKADGLIVASATGSTAYNLAAGGPIVHPRVDALVLTPIAPHTLTHRPVVIPGTETVEVRPIPDAGADDIYVTYDGQSGYPLQKGDSIRIRKHAQALRLVKAPARSYFEVLREKLKWGER
jgi:NAD+ kinase